MLGLGIANDQLPPRGKNKTYEGMLLSLSADSGGQMNWTFTPRRKLTGSLFCK